MAARLSATEVLQELSFDDGENDLSKEKDGKSRLAELLETFECGENFDKALFVKSAHEMLSPLVDIHICKEKETEKLPSLPRALCCSTINAAVVFRSESELWLKRIHRRLAGKTSIRQPYYCEIRRDIPAEMFNVLFRSLNVVAEFREPFCYVVGNRKGKVISFTFLPLLKTFLSKLSGRSVNEITQYLERTLKGRRKDHTTKVLVTINKQFALTYVFAKGQLTVSFNYGEWNQYGFPQHNCQLPCVTDAVVNSQ